MPDAAPAAKKAPFWNAKPADLLAQATKRAQRYCEHLEHLVGPQGSFLTIGLSGHQPELGDWYSNNGSMYIASAGLLALGLPASNSFWTAPAQDWTQKKAFSGNKFPKGYPVSY